MIHTIDLYFQKNACTIGAYVIESGEGPVLIEAGPHSTHPILIAGIKEAGFNPEDIAHVFLSHIHLDHAGAAWAWAEQGAKVYLHPKGFPHMQDPGKLIESATRIYGDKMDELWGEIKPVPEESMHQMEDEEVIKVGNLAFKAWYTPGHAHHHIAWEMEGILFTGDVAGVQIGKGPVVAPMPPPDINVELWEQSIELLRKISPKAFYLTHFGAVTNINPHLDQLLENIHSQANWIKEQMEAEKTAEEITPLFEEFCLNELVKLELSEVEITQYQAANPSWMSVGGIMRYWKKKAEGKL